MLWLVKRTSLVNKVPWANSQRPNVSARRSFRLVLAVALVYYLWSMMQENN